MPNYRLTKAFYQFSLQTAVGNSTEVTKRSAERFSSLHKLYELYEINDKASQGKSTNQAVRELTSSYYFRLHI